MIAAKNMAGKERVDSSMLPTCSLRASVHNAIVCANRKFCWQRLLYGKATAKGMEAAPRVGGVSKLYWRFFSALRRSEISSWARPSRRSLRILMDKAVAKCPPSAFRNNNRATPSPSKSRKKFWRWPLSTGKRGWCQASARRSTAAGRGASLSVTNVIPVTAAAHGGSGYAIIRGRHRRGALHLTVTKTRIDIRHEQPIGHSLLEVLQHAGLSSRHADR